MGRTERHAEPLRCLRLNAGLTLGELASAAEVSQGTVSRLEHGERAPLHAIERRVADALGVAVEAIAWGASDGDGRPAEPFDLTAAREARGLRPNDIAARARVPIRTVRRAEDGAAIHPRYAKRLADFYGTTVVSFYPREAEPVA